ncbi:N-terminal phage integrase SAM-like domain-containing protein, partial [Mycobacterium sp.]|uniref:N-terminal phage integrase SAM-like domain-containing protein n=1 Tax=Mycobacterium sp. TaxID=1785 RepID=UPI00126AB497
MSRRRFGSIRRLPSGRWQARYTGPGGTRRKAPDTFAAKLHAEAWLADEARKIDAGLWNPLPRAGRGAPTLGEYFELWLAGRQLRPRTRYLYESLWRNHIGPDLGDTRINEITAERVRGWWTGLDTGPTAKSHAYS